MDIAKRITQLRSQKNLTVNKLANLAGLSQGFVRQIELGEKKPGIDSLSLICEVLDISLSDFFSEDESISRTDLINQLHHNIAFLSNHEIITLIHITNSMKP